MPVGGGGFDLLSPFPFPFPLLPLDAAGDDDAEPEASGLLLDEEEEVGFEGDGLSTFGNGVPAPSPLSISLLVSRSPSVCGVFSTVSFSSFGLISDVAAVVPSAVIASASPNFLSPSFASFSGFWLTHRLSRITDVEFKERLAWACGGKEVRARGVREEVEARVEGNRTEERVRARRAVRIGSMVED